MGMVIMLKIGQSAAKFIFLYINEYDKCSTTKC